MSASFFSKLRYSLFFFGITLCTGITQADDTEIYFTGAQTELTRPNVLLILDTSGSMDSVVTGTSQTRIEAMKEAMVEIIEGMEDVNVGLMRFTYKQGGPVLHEIRYIDDPLATGGSVSATITASDNDAEEDVGTGVVTVADPVLDIAQVGFSSPISIRVSDDFDDADERDGSVDADTNDNFRVGYSGRVDGARFTGIDIPPNGGGITTTITGATLTLWPSGSTPNDTDTDLSVEVVDNATAFADNFNNLSSRTISTDPPSNTHVDWDNIATTDPVSSPDISSLIQLIIDRPGWSAGNAINIFAENGSGTDRAFQSHDTNPSEAPLLTIAFTTTAATTTQLTGLRFEDIDIPQGATITSAVLNLTPSSSDTDSGTAEVWRITAENDASGNSAAFDSGIANDISARTDTTAFVDYNVPDTTINSPIQIPNLNAVIQEVIKDNGAWCGGNALTLFIADQSGDEARHIHSYDGSGTPPTLDITYDLASATGCYEATETAQIQTGVDDVEQDGSTMDRNSGDMDVAEKLVGLRFQDVDIPQGATILSASIQFKATGSTTSGNPKVDIVGELIGDAPAFTTNANNLSGRTPTAAEIEWTTGDWSDNEVSADTTTPDLTAIVQEIVNLPGASGWASGNSMVFRFDTSSNRRSADSYEGSANNAARLSVSYRGSGGTQVVTVRDNLVDIVNALPSNDYTPITEVFYEAAHYWRGESVEYGTGRDNRSDTRLSTPNTYTGGTIYNPPGCPADNLDDSDCSSRAINGNPVYTSPFSSTLTCQANYQVLMTDGEANENNADDEIRSEYLSNAACQSTKSDASAVTAGELCSIDLVEYMHENDQSTLDNDQLVTTYTVGFDTAGLANATQFLQDVAAAGGGDFFQADNKQGLIDTFNAILTDVKDDPTSFVAPSLATNSFNRLLSRDEAYFGLFTPSLDVRWPGNVKKYRVCIDSSDGCTLGEILDATGSAAVGSDNRFLDTAQSIWSDTGDDAGTVDGRETTLGGVGGDTVDFNTRII